MASAQSVAGISFRINGIKEINARVGKVISAMRGEEKIAAGQSAKDVFVEAAQVVRGFARTNAPYDDRRKKGTHLRDAIFVNAGDPGQPNALVGVRYKAPGAPHSHIVEYGSVKMAAHPFMRPAIQQASESVKAIIKNGLLKIIANNSK